MGNCTLQRRKKKLRNHEVRGGDVAENMSQNFCEIQHADDEDKDAVKFSAVDAIVRFKKTVLSYPIPLSYSFHNSEQAVSKAKNFRELLKVCVPTIALRKDVINNPQNGVKIIPLVYATALGFANLEKAWKRCKLTRRPGIKPSRGSSGKPFWEGNRNEVQSVPPEKKKWWRYTMFLIVDTVDKEKFPRKFSENGGQLVSVESRTGCELRIGEKKFLYRGNLVRHFFIDGPTQNHIVCCKNTLPRWLLKNVIIDHEICFRNEPIAGDCTPIELEKFTEFGGGVNRHTTLVN
ncbi:hypothetical protein Aperf_G00000127243 [Anoplocephala perfoliata]